MTHCLAAKIIACLRLCKFACLFSAVSSHLLGGTAGLATGSKGTSRPLPFAADGIGPLPSHSTTGGGDRDWTTFCKPNRSMRVGVVFTADLDV